MSVIALAAGGTAGHVNPALALAEELRDRGHDVRFYGTERGMESRLVPAQGFAYTGLDLQGFDRSRPWTGAVALVKERRARKRLLADFSRDGAPGAVVGFGAYVCFPLVAAAAKAQVPLVLHEQNSVAGMANKLLARKASVLALTYPAAQAQFAGKTAASTRVLVCGNPVRRSVLAPTREQGRAALGLPADATVLLVFGGSLGARHINDAVAALKDRLLADPSVYVLHAAGARDHERAAAALALTDAERARWRLVPYIEDMGSCLAAADLVLSRAGASSVAEIAARCVPSVLVPYPYATENHQAANAALLTDVGGALAVDDDALDGAAFADGLLGLLADPDRRARMRAGLEGLGGAGAAGRLADAVEAAAAGR
jgi:UDP-N-acetylglucosamine--N-acetylmuramyl-(pentapeptide) pyrophosphoryl-undecaprenol N-acetylglucosamine transferase